MKLKYIVPDMAQTFGNLEFAGENEVEQQRVNGRFIPVTRSYNLYSDIQRADDIIAVLPAKAGEKRFKYEQKVKLINPKITAEGKNVRGRGYTCLLYTSRASPAPQDGLHGLGRFADRSSRQWFSLSLSCPYKLR